MWRSLVLLMVAGVSSLPMSVAQAQSKLSRIDSDVSAGLSGAVVIEDSQLVHTTQLLPVSTDGQLVGETSEEQLHRLLERLDQVIKFSQASRSSVVKLNFYVADSQVRQQVAQQLSNWFGVKSLPAVSYVATTLPVSGAKVAADAVIATDAKLSSLGTIGKKSRFADWCVMPRGDAVYVSGQAEKGELAEATRATLDSLARTLEQMKLDRQHIVGLKCFLQPMSQIDVVNRELKRFFGDAMIPPVSYVEWISGSVPIEIELIAHAPSVKAKSSVSYVSLPWLSTSPVYSRVARIHGDRRIYVSGLYSKDEGNGEVQTREIFRSLAEILAKAGSDMRHLAKATYYVSDQDASSQLNAFRPMVYDPKRPPAASKVMVKDVAAEDRSLTIDMIAAPALKTNSPNQ